MQGFREMLMSMQKQGRVTVDGHSYNVSDVPRPWRSSLPRMQS